MKLSSMYMLINGVMSTTIRWGVYPGLRSKCYLESERLSGTYKQKKTLVVEDKHIDRGASLLKK